LVLTKDALYQLSYVGRFAFKQTSARRVPPPRRWTGEDQNFRSPQGAADLQSAAINRSATCPRHAQHRSWRRELNPRPADYKSAALPTELRQRRQMYDCSTAIWGL